MSNNRFYDPFSALHAERANNQPVKDLYASEQKKNLYLIRRDTGEKIAVNTARYLIGSKTDVCNYIVTDNKYVGREHAYILLENGAAFFVDNNSTNKSYVNGVQAIPQQRIPIKNGDEIKLANLPFVCSVE